MNRVFRCAVLLLSGLLPLSGRATVQIPEVLVVGSDTLEMFAMPLESAPAGVRLRLEELLDAAQVRPNTACRRGYVGLWRLERGALWLEAVRTCAGRPVATGAELLPLYASGSAAWTPWVEGTIRCGSGDPVYAPPGGFERYLAHERQLTLRGGCVVRSSSYENRAYAGGVEPDENARRMRAAFDASGAGRLPEEMTLDATFAADASGRVVRVEHASLICRDGEETVVIEDADDPRLREALRVLRAATRWNSCRVAGEWMAQHQVLPVYRRAVRCE